MQFQTYCLETEDLQPGSHKLEIFLGSGWYTGRYMSLGPGKDRERYGSQTAALAELHLFYADDSREVIVTDRTWTGGPSKVRENSIYDGELYDDTFTPTENPAARELEEIGYDRLKARLSLPVKVKQVLRPTGILHTPKGETVLDFGQNMVGWVRFYNRLPKGKTCSYQAGEILQENCFYRENYRSAESEFTYISDGVEKWIRPHFTWFGFRYLKLEGFPEDLSPDDFEGWVLYSDLEQTGHIDTGNEKVNQLISNVIWGQRGNFLDVPTDCPQRDERFGWTGDAQVFSMTAAYNMDVAAFFRKYMYDARTEQVAMDGRIPFSVPNICFGEKVSAAWGDMATIIPWNMYLMYGDEEMLREQYPGMKAWADYIRRMDDGSGAKRLWTTNAHFGDWLTLDDPGTGQPTGNTDMNFIATAYYYLSVRLTEKAAGVLKIEKEQEEYHALGEEIRSAFQREYLSANGRLTIDTQTAYALVLYTGLYREGQEQRLVDGLAESLKKNNYYLNTGFVGTPLLCIVLSRYGRNDLAYRLLLNEDYPGWLYCVNMGATTIWERWNSVMPDGSMNPEGMNSLNHYPYGAVLEWMYRYVLGIQPMEEHPGFSEFYLTPMPDRRLGRVSGSYLSRAGKIGSAWEYRADDSLCYQFDIPYG
ncbi:MAG: glycoside hydrolase family 78 protein, partial [Clostridiales bacterium]|nr:glycoside hydrolase family 78 protein [Clostridiales bacterium]